MNAAPESVPVKPARRRPNYHWQQQVEWLEAHLEDRERTIRKLGGTLGAALSRAHAWRNWAWYFSPAVGFVVGAIAGLLGTRL